MLCERDIYSKENTNPTNNNAGNSDDSYSGASFPWFPSQNRRKSRLGTYRKERKVLPDVAPDNDVLSECKPSTLNQESRVDGAGTSLGEPVFETQPKSPQSNSVSTLQPIVESSSFIDDFKLPSASSTSVPFCSSFEPSFNIPSRFSDFKTPSLSPHQTPMETFESMSSFSVPPKELKFSSQSLHFMSVDNLSNCRISPPANDFEASKLSSSMPVRKVPLHDRSNESGFFSDHEFKIPAVSPTPVPPVVSLKPFSLAKESNSILKSSLKKPSSSASEDKIEAINHQVQQKPPESPRKEVRFVEPAAPPPKITTRNPFVDLPDSVITVKNKTYKIKRKLGRGGSSAVFEVEDPITNDRLAIKRVELSEDEDFAKTTAKHLKEVEYLERLRSCEHIINIYDHELVYENGTQVLYIVLEKGDTDLSRKMRNMDKEDKLCNIPSYWRQMLKAVCNIHDAGIVHMDLKPANFVFVGSDLKLIDFGISTEKPRDLTSVYLKDSSGTLSYISPEALRMTECAEFRVNEKADVWSLGCILFRWIYDRIPFPSLNDWQLRDAIMSPDRKVEFPERADVPEAFLRTMQSCLQKDPKARPTVKELLLQMKFWTISFDQRMH